MNPEVFLDFARLKLAADGSDSYIDGAVQVARNQPDPFFYLGVFTTFYAPPAQDVFCSHWSREMTLEAPDLLEAWVTTHWGTLPLSGARRTGGFTPKKVRDAILGWATFLQGGGFASLARDVSDLGSFEEVFPKFLKRVPYHGRYTGLKLYEACRRMGAPVPPVDTIVPKDGRTPRKGLKLLYPVHDYKANDHASLAWADAAAKELARAVPCSTFNVEMLLCNFTKAVSGSYYPGHALDRDLGRVPGLCQAFGPRVGFELYKNRSFLYPPECLGELQGWYGRRKELERCYPDYGYFWSDVKYDYAATTDLSEPVKRIDYALTPVVGFGEEPA